MTTATLLRFLRLAALLTIVPNIRSCDDASGMRQTVGFPLPYAIRVNAEFALQHVDWVMLAADGVLLTALAVLLVKFVPALAQQLTTRRVFITLAAYGAFTLLFGWIVFIPLLIPALALNVIVELYLPSYMDVASRVALTGVMLLAARSASPPRTYDT